MATQFEKAQRFQDLHEAAGAFIVPNPWDVGTAKLLESLGFSALATTSSGFAHTLGRPDGSVTLDEKLEHCRALCAATEIPVSADLENGYGNSFNAIATTIRRAAEAGVVGGSVEDYTGDPSAPIYERSLAVERVHAAVEAARSLEIPFTLTARAEGLLHGHGDLADAVWRLEAYEAVGADVLYAPALRTLEDVRAVTAAVGKPVNVLAPLVPGATVAELADAGAKRISIGGALVRATLGPLLRATEEMQELGSFGWAHDLPRFSS